MKNIKKAQMILCYVILSSYEVVEGAKRTVAHIKDIWEVAQDDLQVVDETVHGLPVDLYYPEYLEDALDTLAIYLRALRDALKAVILTAIAISQSILEKAPATIHTAILDGLALYTLVEYLWVLSRASYLSAGWPSLGTSLKHTWGLYRTMGFRRLVGLIDEMYLISEERAKILKA